MKGLRLVAKSRKVGVRRDWPNLTVKSDGRTLTRAEAYRLNIVLQYQDKNKKEGDE